MLLNIALTNAQLYLIIAVAIVFAALFAGNSVLLVLFFRKRKKSKLCTEELQKRREELLEELHALQLSAANRGVTSEDLDDEEDEADDSEEEEEGDEGADEEGEEAEEENLPEIESAASEGEGSATVFEAEILAVRDMPALLREKFGFVGEEYEKKRYYVRPQYSFGAKLRRSNYDIRTDYTALANAAGGLKGCKIKRSFRAERVSIGRKTVALFLFKGKRLCIALALDPNTYAETKYRGLDVSHKKRFASTPMLLKITSARRVEHARYLIAELAKKFGVAYDPDFKAEYDFTVQSREEMIASGNVKYTVLGEAADLVDETEDAAGEAEEMRAGILAVNDMSKTTRAALGLIGREYDSKRYYVRYNYGFEARLRLSSDEVKRRFASLLSEVTSYEKLKIKESFRALRLVAGRNKTIGQILFKGKTLCFALALDPNSYAETKYRGTDVSAVRRFAATPMLLKLTSDRRLGYAKYLFTRVAEENHLVPHFGRAQEGKEYAEMDRNELFAAGYLKITVIGEAPERK